MPVTWEHFDDQALVAMRSNVQASMPAERCAERLSWLFPSTHNAEIIGLFNGMKACALPEEVARTASIAEKSLPEER